MFTLGKIKSELCSESIDLLISDMMKLRRSAYKSSVTLSGLYRLADEHGFFIWQYAQDVLGMKDTQEMLRTNLYHTSGQFIETRCFIREGDCIEKIALKSLMLLLGLETNLKQEQSSRIKFEEEKESISGAEFNEIMEAIGNKKYIAEEIKRDYGLESLRDLPRKEFGKTLKRIFEIIDINKNLR